MLSFYFKSCAIWTRIWVENLLMVVMKVVCKSEYYKSCPPMNQKTSNTVTIWKIWRYILFYICYSTWAKKSIQSTELSKTEDHNLRRASVSPHTVPARLVDIHLFGGSHGSVPPHTIPVWNSVVRGGGETCLKESSVPTVQCHPLSCLHDPI